MAGPNRGRPLFWRPNSDHEAAARAQADAIQHRTEAVANDKVGAARQTGDNIAAGIRILLSDLVVQGLMRFSGREQRDYSCLSPWDL